eukprot:GHRR01028580.1.p1 GENE.GHRR01028580.1~~GHRR01028580.1.p1  ORF type:complete len:272 (+),score=74.94 GHRR01028580.1:288-1103(+)
MEILRAATRHTGSVAIHQPNGHRCSYGKLLESSEALKTQIQSLLPANKGYDGPRVGIYAEPGPHYVAATWATWLSGGIAVPLAVTHPPHELDYVIRDAGISLVLTTPSGHSKLADIAAAAKAAFHQVEDALFEGADAHVNAVATTSSSSTGGSYGSTSSSSSSDASGSLIIYTSGTTGKPKGVLHTHASLISQAQCLSEAWQWSVRDNILHALPLHHIHGIVNALHCAHYSGATVTFLPKFSPAAMWKQLMVGQSQDNEYQHFHQPTMLTL